MNLVDGQQHTFYRHLMLLDAAYTSTKGRLLVHLRHGTLVAALAFIPRFRAPCSVHL